MIRFICQVFFTFIIECHWIFFTIQDSTVSGSYIVIPKEEETWLSANRICNSTYKGKLLSSVEGSRQKMECLYNFTSGVELWSRKGLILSPYLSHEGCFEISTDLEMEKISPIHSVGECYIHCEGRTSTYFGIMIDSCYCITDIEKQALQRTSYSSCNQHCRNSTYEMLEYCGGTMTLNVFTRNVRKVIGNPDVGDGRCAVIDCTFHNYHLSSQKCDDEFKYVCAQGNYRNGKKVNFTQASSLCTSQYNSYLSPSFSPICTDSQSQAWSKYWLDVRRYWAPISDIPYHTTEIEFRCGYFFSGISAKMGFEDKCINNGTKKRYACETDAAPTQGRFFSCPHQSITTQALDITTELQSQSTQLDSSTSTRVTSSQSKEITSITYTQDTSITTEGYINLISMNRPQSGSSSAIIGAVVGVLVTTGLVVGFIIVLVLRRQKVKQRERSKSEEVIDSQESKNNFKLEEVQNASQSHEIDQESRHYFQLEAIPKHNIDVGSPPQMHLRGNDEYIEADDTIYHETGNDVYDHLNQKRKKTTDNEDMYHIANGFQSDNDEYQHIHSLKGVTNRDSSSDYAKFNEDQYSAIQRDK